MQTSTVCVDNSRNKKKMSRATTQKKKNSNRAFPPSYSENATLQKLTRSDGRKLVVS